MTNKIQNKEALIKIAEKLSVKHQGVAKDENGNISEKYLEYLSIMYGPEEAEIVQYLEIFPNGVRISRIAKKLGRDKDELKNLMAPLVKRGFIQKIGSHYSIPSPLLIYDAPFILKINYEDNKEETTEMARLSKEFFEEGYYKQWETSIHGRPRSRVLTVSEKIDPADFRDIVPVEEIYQVIEKNESFAIQPCPCRLRAELMGIRKCKDKYPIENCIALGPMAEGLLELGDPNVHRGTKEEVKNIIKEASELGLVHTTDNYAGQANILCSCCECCCGLLAGLTRSGLDNPRAIAKANFIATINEDECVACGTCLERCKFGAITINEFAEINEKRCVGCGLCAFKCPNEAITMKRSEREPIPGL
jgi:Pyruvate/2-oxoacid:ferredoxin oxidoreductase delta subunit/predicted transcriptional regulator